MSSKKSKQSLLKYIILLLISVVVLLLNYAKDTTNENLSVYFLDIGQGDATYIRDLEGNDILIDGGPNTKLLEELGRHMPFYDNTIEYLFVTHAHADHIGGLVELLDYYQIKNIYMTDAVSDTAMYLELLDKIKLNNIPVHLVHQKDEIQISESLKIDILWPESYYANKEVEDLNETSIVCILNYHNIKMLFTGDAEADVYEKIVSKYSSYELKSDILKVPHHGSKDADDYGFIKIVNPDLAVIEVGANNSFGHPHQDTLDKLQTLDIKILRTDLDGTIKLITDGLNFWTETHQ